jgi:4-hydroxybenzoate polyprenyltransferase
LILLIPLLVIWIIRLWTVATNGKMNSDPIIFVIKDYASYIFGIIFIFTILAAKFI